MNACLKAGHYGVSLWGGIVIMGWYYGVVLCDMIHDIWSYEETSTWSFELTPCTAWEAGEGEKGEGEKERRKKRRKEGEREKKRE